MTKLILLDNYNNYYNRISRKSSTIEDYIANRNYRETGFVNFNPADGVSTSHIINWPESWNPDYCLVVDEADNIISRWFIIESTFTLGKNNRSFGSSDQTFVLTPTSSSLCVK